MIALAIQVGDPIAYAPCGIRISQNANYRELAEDVLAFFVDAEERDNPQLALLRKRVDENANQDLLRSAMLAVFAACADGRAWGIYNDEDGGYDDLT